MWRTVGGGRGARRKTGCQGWTGWSWWGSMNRHPTSQSLGDSGLTPRPSLALEVGIQDTDLPLQKSRTEGPILGTTPIGKVLKMGEEHNPT